MARTLLAQIGESRANNAERREQVDVEQTPRFGVRGFLERAQETVSRVIDNHVDLACAGEGLPHRRFYCFAVGDVELHDVQCAGSGRQVGRLVANRADDRVAFGQRRMGESVAKASRNTCYEPCPHDRSPFRMQRYPLRVRFRMTAFLTALVSWAK